MPLLACIVDGGMKPLPGIIGIVAGGLLLLIIA